MGEPTELHLERLHPTIRRLRIRVVEGPDRDRIIEHHGDRLGVGTSPANELTLTDPTVSHYHLELRCEDGVLVKDLGSRNGTFVGDVKISEALVPIGTRVRIGRTVLSLLDATIEAPDTPLPPPNVPGLVAASAAMQEVGRTVERLAQSTVSVLIQGETGTGKELVARAIHDLSARAKEPFIVVDPGALPATLIASQLFGHERGAFTGAEKRQEGAFELAHGGSIFLDEIGELPLAVQPALLGVLERRSFRRLGGKEDIQVDVRVISATHRDLRAEANQGPFRADLYFRLAVARIEIPALRDRPEDIDPLVSHFAAEITGAPGFVFSEATMNALRGHRWSGNVRELRNVVESALAMGSINLNGLAQPAPPAPNATIVPQYRVARAEALATFERSYLRRLIETTNGNASAAARAANMDRPYLLSLLRRHGLR
ncbi:MAG TPA: sigma 54-interacting transcriptional regulator [Polyangia bacterium]|nr:sigma 54-interacting transcriptional regulator [Polyangia bacterium]